jgi:hypothetical protein
MGCGMRRMFGLLVPISVLAVALLFASDHPATNASPVLVELFTSEGCSSCPPADRLLQDLDRTQPVAGAELIVLSEHVDYWNHIGWADPFSSKFFSDRQSAYSDHFGLNSVYTPEMVVDGDAEFVGSDSRHAEQACKQASESRKVPVRISNVALNGNTIRAHVESDAVPSGNANVYVVVALNHAESQVQRGENAGRHLSHVAVVQSLNKVGSAEKGKPFAQDVSVKINPGTDLSNLRLIAFVQENGPGKVLGAALERVQK